MKKTLPLIAITIIISIGCNKEVNYPLNENNNTQNVDFETGGIKPVKAQAKIINDQTFGWALLLQNNQIVVPSNLPESYHKENQKVDVTYFFTEKKVPCNCAEAKYYVEITQIKLIVSLEGG